MGQILFGSFGSSLQFASKQGLPHSVKYSFGPHVPGHSPSGTQFPVSEFLLKPISQRQIGYKTKNSVMKHERMKNVMVTIGTSDWIWIIIAVCFHARVSEFFKIFIRSTC